MSRSSCAARSSVSAFDATMPRPTRKATANAVVTSMNGGILSEKYAGKARVAASWSPPDMINGNTPHETP